MRLTLIIIFLTTTLCFSQKQYEFDYLIEYELTTYKDSIRPKNRLLRNKDKISKKYYLTNSKKNNYTAIITEFDSLNYSMEFVDYNGIYSKINFLKSELNKAEFIKIKCQNVSKFSNPFKYQIRNYSFSEFNDTILNDKPYGVHKFASIKPNRIKRKKLGSEFYIIDKETSFHLPILNRATAYEEWKKERNIPNGIFIEKYFINYFGHLSSKEKLKGYWKVNKKIIVDSDCDYTKK